MKFVGSAMKWLESEPRALAALTRNSEQQKKEFYSTQPIGREANYRRQRNTQLASTPVDPSSVPVSLARLSDVFLGDSLPLQQALQPQSVSYSSMRLLGKLQFLGVPSFNGLIVKGSGTSVSLCSCQDGFCRYCVTVAIVTFILQIPLLLPSISVGAGLLKSFSSSVLSVCLPLKEGFALCFLTPLQQQIVIPYFSVYTSQAVMELECQPCSRQTPCS